MGDRPRASQSAADVAVVGAGVAGCATALHLARAGHQVLLVDRDTFPREKACGEGLMPHGVAELEALGIDVPGRPFRGIAYHLDGTAAFGRFPPREGHRDGLGVRRLHLDAALVDACGAHPRIALRTGLRVADVEVGPGGATLDTAEGPLGTRVVVGADGRGSRIRRALGLDRETSAAPRYGVRAHYRIAGEAPHEVRVYVAPDHEFYVTPTGPREINVALLCGRETTRSLAGDLEGGYQRLVRDFAPVAGLVEGAELLTAPTLVGPLRQAVTAPVADRALLVGDAAGFVDAVTGEGMSLALVTARLAAETLDGALRADTLRARDLAPYATGWRRAVRDATWLTEIVLWGLRHRWLARRGVQALAKRPDLFGRVLAVQTGQAPLQSLGLGGLWSLLRG